MVIRILNAITKSKQFVTVDIWRVSLEEFPRIKSFFVKQLRTILLAIQGFNQDNCLLRASALTFYSLLSIVPVVAMAFGVAKGFGFEKHLETLLLERLPGQERVIFQVVAFARALLEKTQGGMIAGIGMVVLLWSVIKLLGQIESAFNGIWEVRKSRPFGTKLIYYVFIMIVGPMLVVVSSSMTVFVTTQIERITEQVALLGMFSPVILGGLKLLPYCLIGVLLTVLYIYMPNTKVKIGAGLIAGIISGIVYVIVQWAYINFQIGIAKYNAIYGSFAALPLFLIWLQISWFVVLFGAEIAFAVQNVTIYEFEQDVKEISHYFKRLVSLQIAHLLVQRFSKGEKPLTCSEISRHLHIPVRLVLQILYELVDSDIVSIADNDDSKGATYQPALDIHQISIKYVLDALNQKGTENIPVLQSGPHKALKESLEKISNTIQKSPANRLLKDI